MVTSDVATPLQQTVQRRSKRFALQVSVGFVWKMGGQRQRATGMTRDISVNSAFICADECPPVNTEVSLEFRIPAPFPGCAQLHCKATGHVVRVERLETGWGFAVTSEKHFSFKKNSPVDWDWMRTMPHFNGK